MFKWFLMLGTTMVALPFVGRETAVELGKLAGHAHDALTARKPSNDNEPPEINQRNAS